jgi:hypothetical protein
MSILTVVTPLNVCLSLSVTSLALGRLFNSDRFYLLAGWYAVQTGLELVP